VFGDHRHAIVGADAQEGVRFEGLAGRRGGFSGPGRGGDRWQAETQRQTGGALQKAPAAGIGNLRVDHFSS
jgi:hypothetical protein